MVVVVVVAALVEGRGAEEEEDALGALGLVVVVLLLLLPLPLPLPLFLVSPLFLFVVLGGTAVAATAVPFAMANCNSFAALIAANFSAFFLFFCSLTVNFTSIVPLRPTNVHHMVRNGSGNLFSWGIEASMPCRATSAAECSA